MKKALSILILLCFFITSIVGLNPVLAQGFVLPAPGVMIPLSPEFNPPILKGIKVHPDNPFKFDFIIDTGNSRLTASNSQLKEESNKLIKYFLAAMTVPEKDLWVNLSPYEKGRMIAPNLGETEMGRDMLAEDYILKQLTASLIYPGKNLGKTFWDEVYEKAQQLYGTTQVPVNTFNKIWIIADRADVFERGNVAYIVGAHMKVMLEEDYLALNKNSISANEAKQSHTIASQIIRQIILPQIEKEINTGKNFAPLRQIYYSMILASWYKMALKNALVPQLYGNQNKVKVGINVQDPKEKDKIFEQYLKAYKKGVFNYIKEDINARTGKSVPRKYFSGGEDLAMLGNKNFLHRITDAAQLSQEDFATKGNLVDAAINVNPAQMVKDSAMQIDFTNGFQSKVGRLSAVQQDFVQSLGDWFEKKMLGSQEGVTIPKGKEMVISSKLAENILRISIQGYGYFKQWQQLGWIPQDSSIQKHIVDLNLDDQEKEILWEVFLKTYQAIPLEISHDHPIIDATLLSNTPLSRMVLFQDCYDYLKRLIKVSDDQLQALTDGLIESAIIVSRSPSLIVNTREVGKVYQENMPLADGDSVKLKKQYLIAVYNPALGKGEEGARAVVTIMDEFKKNGIHCCPVKFYTNVS